MATGKSTLALTGAPTHLQSAGSLLNAIAQQTASKGFRLHHCVPLTGDTREYWMVQRGFQSRFFESVSDLQTAVDEMSEWRCRTPEAAAQEAALRAALSELNEEVSRG